MTLYPLQDALGTRRIRHVAIMRVTLRLIRGGSRKRPSRKKLWSKFIEWVTRPLVGELGKLGVVMTHRGKVPEGRDSCESREIQCEVQKRKKEAIVVDVDIEYTNRPQFEANPRRAVPILKS